jgi:hypothetical protein
LDDGRVANLFEQCALGYKVQVEAGQQPVIVVVGRDVIEALA